MPATLAGGVSVSFGGTAYTVTGISVQDSIQMQDITTLDDSTFRRVTKSALKDAAQATLDFLGYGPRAAATGSFTAPGVSGIGGTVISSSTTLAVGEPVRSQATIQFRR